ncbi:helix-turn-helix domain-containing protein [Streptomyces rectiverticillatus]|uniref:helix-turn-helix domain-containing protein n=1 Tax=Streptomyces rectiverticillatus TaxID=173860 RepID=UPI001FEBC0A6|nr:helix-turn-helix domain-containing protein [Streptomyces rectiverticillatus]
MPNPVPTPTPTPIPLRPAREPLWRDVVGDVLRRERLAQKRTLKDVAEAGRISMPYLSEVERGRKEASSEVLAAAAQALGLSLAELLALVQAELIRLASRTHVHVRPVVRQAAAPQSAPRHNEVRLAA